MIVEKKTIYEVLQATSKPFLKFGQFRTTRERIGLSVQRCCFACNHKFKEDDDVYLVTLKGTADNSTYGKERFVANSESTGSERECSYRPWKEEFTGRSIKDDYELPADRWADFPAQSPVCSRDDELSSRLVGITFPKWRAEAIKALGNAWCVAVAYEIFRAINEIENGDK